MASIKRPPVFRVAVIQLACLVPVSACLTVVNTNLAVSLLAGGLIAVIPHLYFTLYAFRYMGARASNQIARSFYRGETGKFLLTLVGFGCAFAGLTQLRPLALFSGYLLMLILQWWLVARAVRQ
ncbi:ATP synthase subunit I [Pseudomaricurvus alkylphenolicus]|uniref:ATP synthase subunit I n=1 Tax=Pseudomaricurvus alkylphenolicus TaxID=1306991 RepID=UPI00197D98A6|nr:ATP synthase subunit I [Pseudomaricurvus alkylphenolicus]